LPFSPSLSNTVARSASEHLARFARGRSSDRDNPACFIKRKQYIRHGRILLPRYGKTGEPPQEPERDKMIENRRILAILASKPSARSVKRNKTRLRSSRDGKGSRASSRRADIGSSATITLNPKQSSALSLSLSLSLLKDRRTRVSLKTIQDDYSIVCGFHRVARKRTSSFRECSIMRPPAGRIIANRYQSRWMDQVIRKLCLFRREQDSSMCSSALIMPIARARRVSFRSRPFRDRSAAICLGYG